MLTVLLAKHVFITFFLCVSCIYLKWEKSFYEMKYVQIVRAFTIHDVKYNLSFLQVAGFLLKNKIVVFHTKN